MPYTLVSQNQKDLIRSAAGQLLARAGVTGPPVDLERLAMLQGVREIVIERLDHADAELSPVDQGYVIKVDPRAKEERYRFSVAHEIGHTFFRHNHKSFRGAAIGVAPARTSRLGYRAEERLCDIAAAELLMPQDMFLRALGETDPSLSEIERLAAMFKASILATASRYSELCGRVVQINRWTASNDTLRPWHNPGLTLCNVSAFCLQNPTGIVESAIREASLSAGSIRKQGADPTSYPHRIQVEAKGFGKGEMRYVLSVIRSSRFF